MDKDAYLRRVQAILWREWDPIGVNEVQQIQDEYDSYAPRIVAMVLTGTTVEAVADYLFGVEQNSMGLEGDRPLALRVAAKVLAAVDKT